MKNDKIQDERIFQERRKIQSKAYGWIVLVLLASIIVQAFFMKAPFAQYAVELFIVIGGGYCTIINNLKKGINVFDPITEPLYGKKYLLRTLLSTLLTAIGSTILLLFLSGNYDFEFLISYFITFTILFFIIRISLIGLTRRKQQTIEKELDEEEKEE